MENSIDLEGIYCKEYFKIRALLYKIISNTSIWFKLYYLLKLINYFYNYLMIYKINTKQKRAKSAIVIYTILVELIKPFRL
jgi:hypothetical protein